MLSLFKIQKTLVLGFCATFVFSADPDGFVSQDFSQHGRLSKQKDLKFVDVTPELVKLYRDVYSLHSPFRHLLSLGGLLIAFGWGGVFLNTDFINRYVGKDSFRFCLFMVAPIIIIHICICYGINNGVSGTKILNEEFQQKVLSCAKQLFAQQQSGACINVQSGPVGALLNWILCLDIPLELREKVFAQRFAQISNSCEFSNAIAAALKAKA